MPSIGAQSSALGFTVARSRKPVPDSPGSRLQSNAAAEATALTLAVTVTRYR